jgi:hypothetical protein
LGVGGARNFGPHAEMSLRFIACLFSDEEEEEEEEEMSLLIKQPNSCLKIWQSQILRYML